MARYSTRNLTVSIKNSSINRLIKDLDIKVSASKTLSSNPNQATIEIYNLNQNSREELYNNIYDIKNKKAITKIEVSLNDEIIFSGDLININSIYSVGAAEWKTVIFCGDGLNAIKKTINKKYEKGSKPSDIIKDMGGILEEEGLAILGAIEGFNACTDRSILKAIVMNGTIITNIKKLLSECFSEADVYIDEGQMNILAEKAIIKANKVIINKGLIDPPTLSEQGINCKVVFNSSIKIGALIQVESRSVNVAMANLTTYRPNKARISGDGIYRVQEIKHTVDNYSQEIASTEIIGLNSGLLNAN